MMARVQAGDIGAAEAARAQQAAQGAIRGLGVASNTGTLQTLTAGSLKSAGGAQMPWRLEPRAAWN